MKKKNDFIGLRISTLMKETIEKYVESEEYEFDNITEFVIHAIGVALAKLMVTGPEWELAYIDTEMALLKMVVR